MRQFYLEVVGLKVAHGGERHEFGGGSGGGGGSAHRSAGHGGFLIRGGSLYSHPRQAIQSFNHQTKGYHVYINNTTLNHTTPEVCLLFIHWQNDETKA